MGDLRYLLNLATSKNSTPQSLSLLSYYFPTCHEPDLTFGINYIGCLQVLHDGCWIDVPPNRKILPLTSEISNIFLILISNYKFASVEHRVSANRGEEPHISITSLLNLRT
ncbi:hypothetical protein HID58_016685 [Brassica napus]|uniref:Isopenicillin N synthase-like Fe(2+) 2OG dioxygenase domain-containing protein n=1 Tax=Brassica napus TaxID=3708 RepID=A0ABQ7XGZ5_BRANA|nr:hypothetical protein HID58_016685 [Brassica napus]